MNLFRKRKEGDAPSVTNIDKESDVKKVADPMPEEELPVPKEPAVKTSSKVETKEEKQRRFLNQLFRLAHDHGGASVGSLNLSNPASNDTPNAGGTETSSSSEPSVTESPKNMSGVEQNLPMAGGTSPQNANTQQPADHDSTKPTPTELFSCHIDTIFSEFASCATDFFGDNLEAVKKANASCAPMRLVDLHPPIPSTIIVCSPITTTSATAGDKSLKTALTPPDYMVEMPQTDNTPPISLSGSSSRLLPLMPKRKSSKALKDNLSLFVNKEIVEGVDELDEIIGRYQGENEHDANEEDDKFIPDDKPRDFKCIQKPNKSRHGQSSIVDSVWIVSFDEQDEEEHVSITSSIPTRQSHRLN